MKLSVFGAGYVGLVTGTGLADLGHDVTVYDIDPGKIAKLNAGEVPIYEPGLSDLIKRNTRSGRLAFVSEITPLLRDAEAYFIAVGTPPAPDGSADLSYVMAAADSTGKSSREQLVKANPFLASFTVGDMKSWADRKMRG